MTEENRKSSDLVWADNADVISLQYAGTGALKTDYTRLKSDGLKSFLIDSFSLERVNDQQWVYSEMDTIHACVMY